jgi:hypothetical protein
MLRTANDSLALVVVLRRAAEERRGSDERR